MNEPLNFRQDFGTYLQETYQAKPNTDIILTDPFTMSQLIILPGMSGSFTTYVDEMCASFDFEEDVLLTFLDILERMGICNKDQTIRQFEVSQGNPLQIDFLMKPILLMGVVLSCRLGERTSSTKTGESFIPVVIQSVKITQEPVAIFLPISQNH